jgi:copper chaperone NosL
MDSIASLFSKDLSRRGRWIIVAASIALIPSMVLPTWKITLHAPQYPDGLELTIYPTTVGGDLYEVNLLNHYIGMHEIEPNEFSEFRFIPFFILRFLGLALLAALAGRMAIAALGYMDFVLFGTVMLYTLQHWLAEFGQNLAPNAPLKMEPFSASFLGTTQIGQFAVSSEPALGAILMAIAGALGPIVMYVEWRAFRSQQRAAA